MSPETITALAAGLAPLLAALAAFIARKASSLASDQRAMRRQLRLADQYIGTLLRTFDLRGITPPKAPEGLFADGTDPTSSSGGDSGEGAAPGAGEGPRAGAHRAP